MQNAMLRIPVLLLFAAALGFAMAPPWVAQGAGMTYSVGSDSVAFRVAGVSGEDIKIEITPSSTHKMSMAIENKSAESGQFWYDSGLLASAAKGSAVGDYTVASVGTETIAGKQWSTITLEDTVSGAKTTKVYDKASGLLLKQMVDSEGVPVVTLASFNIPGLAAAAAPVPTTPQEEGQQNSTSASAGTTPQGNATAPAVEPQADAGSETEEETGGQQTETQPQEDEEKGKCASGAILLAVLGFAAFASAKCGVGRT